MAIDREVNVNVTGSSDELVNATEKAKQSIESNLIKSIEVSEKRLASFNKTSTEASQVLERKLIKSIEITGDSLQAINATSERASTSIKQTLESAAAASESQMKALEASSYKASSGVDSLTNSANNAGEANEKMSSKIERNVNILDGLVNTLSIVAKGLSITGTAFVALVGKEKAFEMINQAAVQFSNIIERIALRLEQLGGPFKTISSLLYVFRDALRTNTAGMAAFALMGTESVESADNMRKSLVKNIMDQTTFTDKLRISSLVLGQYGKTLLATDGILNKIKGTTAVVAGATAGLTATISEKLGDTGDKVLLFAGSFVALAGVDALFKPVSLGLKNLSKEMIIAQNRAAMMSAPLGQTATATQRLAQQFNILKVKGIGVVANGLDMFRDTLIATRHQLRLYTEVGKLSATTMFNLGKAGISAGRHIELFEKGLAGLSSRLSTGASLFTFFGMQLLKTDGILAKMSGVTLVALGVALGGLVLIIKQVLASIGGLIQAIGDKLTKATEKQIEIFAKFEKNTFAFNQTIQSYAKSTEEAAEKTKMWTNYVNETSEASGHTVSSLQALVAETVAATESMHLNEQQMKTLIDRTIDLSERAHKPAMDTLVALINGMNGAGQSVISLGLHINDAAVSHSNLSKEIKENFKDMTDSEKAQVRYAVLMEQAGKAAGFATNNADLLSKSIKIQENAFKELHAELGKGAAIINSKYIFGLATVTKGFTSLLKPLLPTLGFFEALGGHILSATGFFVKHLLTIALVTSSYKALNKFLAKSATQTAFGRSLPVLNKSLTDVAKNLGVVNPKFGSLKEISVTALKALSVQVKHTVKDILKVPIATNLTAKVVGVQLVKGIKAAGMAVGGFSKKLLLLLANPIVLKITLIVGAVYLLYKAFLKLEEETKLFSKIWEDFAKMFAGSSTMFQPLIDIFKQIGHVLMTTVGTAIKFVAAGLAILINTVLTVVKGWMLLSQVFSAILPDSMVASQKSIDSINEKINLLNNTAIKLAKEGASDLVNAVFSSAHAAEVSGKKMRDFAAEISHVESYIEKLEKKAKPAFEALRSFTPKLNMSLFMKETAKFDKALTGLKSKLESKRLLLIESKANQEEVKKVEERIAQTNEALKGLSIRTAQEVRSAKTKELEVELSDRRNKIITVEQELKQMRLNFANETRWQLVDIETQRLLEQRNLATDAAQEGTTIRQQAIIEANSVELEAFRSKLEAEKSLALNMETQKQIELAQLKADALGTSPAGKQAGKDLELLQTKARMEQLSQLKANERISEQEHQQALTQIKLEQARVRTEKEIELHAQRSEALGLTQAGLESRLQENELAFQMEMEQLRVQKENRLLTEQEFQMAMSQKQLENEANRNQIRQGFIQQEIQQNEMRGDSFAASMAKIRLEQEKHGKLMGSIRGIQQTQEFQGTMTAMSNLSSLRNSKSKRMFEIGKKAAIAQATVQMFLGATQAYTSLSSIPIVGPALGAAAAAAAVAAGVVNIQNIKSQKFQGGQADQGMDEIPKSLHGKSFILSAGERVVQPEANKKLTEFLDNQGQGSGGNNITINIGSIDSEERVDELAQRIKEIIRSDSERGEPIISYKGVVNE